MSGLPLLDELFILRAPPELAERLRRLLAEDGGASLATEVELVFRDEREGTLRVGGETFPARLLDLPTKVEAWKTLDDVNLVKSADVGQIVLIGTPGATLPVESVCVNGVTAVMRCANSDRRVAEGALTWPSAETCRRLTFGNLWSMTGHASARWSRSSRGCLARAR